MSSTDQFFVTVHSQKGGVGKTLLAWHLANALARGATATDLAGTGSRRTVLIDADLTGTSLADAVAIGAYQVGGSGRHRESCKVTREVLERGFHGCFPTDRSMPPLAFLNRMLLCDPVEYERLGLWASAGASGNGATTPPLDLGHYLWQHETNRELCVVPSSAHPTDIEEIGPHLPREDVTDHFCCRISDLVLALFGRSSADGSKLPGGRMNPRLHKVPSRAVLVDCPPGLHGISEAVLNCHHEIAKRMERTSSGGALKRIAIFVLGDDQQEVAGIFRSLDGMLSASEKRGRLDPHVVRPLIVLNRYHQTNPDDTKRRPRVGGRPCDLTSMEDAQVYLHLLSRHCLPGLCGPLSLAPGVEGSLFSAAICVPYDRELSTTFKADSADNLPQWSHPDRLMALVGEILG